MDESYYLKPQQVESIIRHCERKVAEGCGFKVNFQSPDDISGAIKTKEGQREYISKTQQYKLAGNSIVVSCLYHVFRKMFIDHSNEQKGYVQLSLF